MTTEMHPSAQRLYELVQENNPEVETQADMARFFETSSQAVKNWENRGVPAQIAIEMEAKYGISPTLLMTGHQPRGQAKRLSHGVIRFDRLDISSHAGDGGFAVDFPSVVDTIEVLESWAFEKLGTNNPDRIKIVTNKGVSMAPTIKDGDILFVDITTRIYDGDGIYVIDWNGRLLTKRLIAKLDNRIAISSDNQSPEYETEYIDINNQDRLSICGRVKAYFSLREVM